MTQLNIAPTPADTAAANNKANAAAGTKQVARWRVADIVALYELPFNDLMFKAQQTHREHFDANTVQLSTLLSIKTGGCEEDCAYCPQSVHHDTGLQADKLMPFNEVLAAAKVAKENGATRFCMGASVAQSERPSPQTGSTRSSITSRPADPSPTTWSRARSSAWCCSSSPPPGGWSSPTPCRGLPSAGSSGRTAGSCAGSTRPRQLRVAAEREAKRRQR